MGIDINEWTERRLNATTRIELTQYDIDLIRTVLADELPKHVAALLEPPKPPEKPQPESGDVPEVTSEWATEVARQNLYGVNAYSLKLHWIQARRIHDAAEAELARRVSEATAAFDERLAKAREMFFDNQRHLSEQLVEARRERDTLKQQLAAAQAEIERLRTDVTDETATLKAENTKLRAQLAAATRPVEDNPENTRYFFVPENIAITGGSTRHLVKAITAIDARNMLQAERAARVAAEKFKAWVHKWLDDNGVPHDPDPEANQRHGCRISGRMEWYKQKLVAAEAERDELREWAKTVIVHSYTSPPMHRANPRHLTITDERLNELLAAFREQKGKVAT